MNGDALNTLSKSGALLVAALCQEASLSLRCRRHPEDMALSAELVSARRKVESCQSAYCDALKEADYPDVPIRRILEENYSISPPRPMRKPKLA